MAYNMPHGIQHATWQTTRQTTGRGALTSACADVLDVAGAGKEVAEPVAEKAVGVARTRKECHEALRIAAQVRRCRRVSVNMRR